MIRVINMDDFEEYIHDLRYNTIDAGEDVNIDTGNVFMDVETLDNLRVLSDILHEMFEGLDVWRTTGGLDTFKGTDYVRSVLYFIGGPVEHGNICGVVPEEEDTEEGW